MKHLNYYLYGAALILVMIPVIMAEAVHKNMSIMGQTIFFVLGALLLIMGKIITVQQKRKNNGQSFFLDIVIIGCLVVMIVWMITKI